MKLNRIAQLSVITLAIIATTGCIIHVGGHERDYHHSRTSGGDALEDISNVLDGIEIEQHRQVGNLSNVNGQIKLHDHVKARQLDVVNGSIVLGKNVSITSASTVNGDIKADLGLVVSDELNTVNGAIKLKSGSTVGSNVTTVNGEILIYSSQVDGMLETKSGDIKLFGGTTVDGNIIYREIDSSFWSQERVPTLTIDADSHIKGKIILYRPVKLDISNEAMLAKIEYRYENQ